MWTFGLLAYVRFFEGRSDEAVDLATQVLRESERRGDHWGEGMMTIILGSVELWSGRTTSAVETLQRSVDVFRRLGDTVGRVQALSALGRALVMSGDVEHGLDAIAEAIAHDPAAPSLDDGGLIALASLLVRVQLGTPTSDADEVDLAPSLVLDGGASEAGQADLSIAVGVGMAQLGRIDEALSLFEQAGRLDDPSASVSAAVTLIGASAGRTDVVAAAAGRVRDADSSTYLDRALAAVAEALVAARGVDGVAPWQPVRDALDLARREVAPTEDVVAAAIVALASAIAAQATDDPEAEVAGIAAEDAWRMLGVEPYGWRTMFAAAAGVPVPGSTPAG
jgi:tetratricopeptide (TPR) repeat protein